MAYDAPSEVFTLSEPSFMALPIVSHSWGTAPSAVAPVISNVSPTAGTQVTSTEAIEFDITDDKGTFRRVIIIASFAGHSGKEVVYDGNFTDQYVDGSTVAAITNGYHFSLVRSPAWPGAITIVPYAFDTEGQEA
jgi:hypothetical protein